MANDFVMTIDSDVELDSEPELPTPGPSKSNSKAKGKTAAATTKGASKPSKVNAKDAGGDTLDPEFVFDLSGDAVDYLLGEDEVIGGGIVKSGTKLVCIPEMFLQGYV